MSAPLTSAQAVVRAAMGLARDAAEGQLDAGALDADLIAQCCALVGLVVGPSDPLWSLQLDVCRQVLAAGGLPLTELAEWCAVLQARQDAPGSWNRSALRESPPDA